MTHRHSHAHVGEPIDPLTFGSEQRCFGCGPHNELGLKLRFAREGDEVVTRFVPPSGYDGPPGIFHGGLQATLLDELAGWTLVGLRSRMGFTTSLRIRYVRPMRIGLEIEGRGRIVDEANNVITVRATLEQEGRVGCRGVMTFVVPDREGAERTLGRPLDPTWHKFCRDS